MCVNYGLFEGRKLIAKSQSSSVSIVTRLRDGRPGFDSWQQQGFSVFITASRPSLGPTQPPIQWVEGDHSLVVNWPGHGAEHSLPSSAEVKNKSSYTFTSPHTSSCSGA
jgi:hypothetical protein